MKKLIEEMLKNIENLQWELDRMSEDGRAQWKVLLKNARLLEQLGEACYTKIKKRKIPVTKKIEMFLHCKKCVKELPGDQSPRDYAAIEAGWSKLGLQLWCKRHEKNILHVDFEGQRHPASLHARRH